MWSTKKAESLPQVDNTRTPLDSPIEHIVSMEPTADFECPEPVHIGMSREEMRCWCLTRAIEAHDILTGDNKTDVILRAAKEFEKYLKES